MPVFDIGIDGVIQSDCSMTIGELDQWRESNLLPDAWYLEINGQGLGGAMTLVNVRAWARDVWRNGGQVRVIPISMAARDAVWIVLMPDHESVCPKCGADCEALVDSCPGEGIRGGEWFGIFALILIAFWTGVTTGAIYGWLLLVFFSMPLIGKFFRQKRAIWRCPDCHLSRSREK